MTNNPRVKYIVLRQVWFVGNEITLSCAKLSAPRTYHASSRVGGFIISRSETDSIEIEVACPSGDLVAIRRVGVDWEFWDLDLELGISEVPGTGPDGSLTLSMYSFRSRMLAERACERPR